MKSRKCIVIFVFLAIILAIAIQVFRVKSSPEPVYEGRSLNEWLNAFASSGSLIGSPRKSNQPSGEDARKAIAAIGLPAIPFIIRKLEENDSPWRNKYRELWPRLPAFVHNHFTKPKDIEFSSGSAAIAFEVLGTNALPQLLPRLKDHNPAVREAVMGYFIACPLLSTNQAISVARRMLSDNDAMVRLQAISMLRKVGPAASNAVPALILALNSNEKGRHTIHNERVFVRPWAATALGKMGPVAANALPALTNLLAATNTDSYLRTIAAEAVWRISSNENLCLPALISCLQTPGPSYNPLQNKTKAVGILKEMGPHAKAAFPELVKLLPTTDTDFHDAITNALFSIDPAAASNVIHETAQK